MEQAASLGLYVMVPLTRGDWGHLSDGGLRGLRFFFCLFSW